MSNRTQIYRVGPEMEDEHYVVIHNGQARPYPGGLLATSVFREAVRQYLTLTGLPAETAVQVAGKAFSLREAEIVERVQILQGSLSVQCLGEAIKYPAKTMLTLFVNGTWGFGGVGEDSPPLPILWQTRVTPALGKAVREAFLGQIAQESREQIDRLRNNPIGDY